MDYMINGKSDNVKSRDVSWTEPQTLDKLNWLIYLQHVRGEISVCNTLIEEEIKRTDSMNDYAFYQKGLILLENGKLQDALDSFQTCYKLNPKNVENIKQIGLCLYNLRRYKMSMEAYLEGEKRSEKPDWEIYHRLSECLFRLGDVNGAKEYSRRSVQLGKQEMSYALLMKILVESNDLRSAVAVSNAALECYPESTEMLTESAILLLRTGQTNQAYDRLNSVLGIEPTAPRSLLAIGSIVQNAGDYDSALLKYKMAVTSLPNSVPLWNNIGLCFYGKQKNVAAMGCLKRSLWFSPLNWRVLYNLGLVHLSVGQAASAFNSLCAAVNLRPDNGLAFMLLACSLLDLKDVENASRAFEHAIRLAPDDSNVVVNNALCAHLAGNEILAVESYRKLLSLIEQDPNVPNEIIDLATKLREVIHLEQFEQGTMDVKENVTNDDGNTELLPDEV